LITGVESLVRPERKAADLVSHARITAVTCAIKEAAGKFPACDQAADLPQDVLRDLGGRPHPMLAAVIAPRETRTLLHLIDAKITGRAGQAVRRDAARRKGRIAQHQIPDETTQVREVLLTAVRRTSQTTLAILCDKVRNVPLISGISRV
jgi:hypothetical protein